MDRKLEGRVAFVTGGASGIGLKVAEGTAGSAETSAVYTEMKATVAQMFDSIHNLALELRPTLLDDLGLVPALANYVRNWPDRFGVQIDFAAPGMSGLRLPREIETTLYRVVQEALTNVARHAEAQRASVLLERRGQSGSPVGSAAVIRPEVEIRRSGAVRGRGE